MSAVGIQALARARARFPPGCSVRLKPGVLEQAAKRQWAWSLAKNRKLVVVTIIYHSGWIEGEPRPLALLCSPCTAYAVCGLFEISDIWRRG